MSKVILGKVARRAKPNRVVQSPTQATAGTLVPGALVDFGGLWPIDPSDTGDFRIPAGLSPGDRHYWALHVKYPGTNTPIDITDMPSGWTLVTEDFESFDSTQLWVFTRELDGSETNGTFTLSEARAWVAVSWGRRGPVGAPVLSATYAVNTRNPPLVDPSEPGLYAVDVLMATNTGVPDPDADGAAPSGYETLAFVQNTNEGRPARLFVAQASVQIATNEDPGVIGWSNDGTGDFSMTMIRTMASRLDVGSPPLASGDHTHQHDTLDGREDVAVNHGSGSATAGQVLTADGAGSASWEDPAGGGDLDDLGDVAITSPADNEVLAFDNSSGDWINQTAAEAGLAAASHTHTESDISDLDHTDTDAIHDNVSGEIAAITEKTTPHDNDLLLIEDSEASNAKKRLKISNLPSGGGGGALDDLSDVTITGPSTGEVLKYDGSAWVNDTDDTGSGSLPTASTKGDIAVFDGSDWVIVPAGSNDHVLTADSAQTAGVKWAAGGGGGGGESFADVLSDYTADLVHAWYCDVASGDVPDEVASLTLTSTGSGSAFDYELDSPFGVGTAMAVPTGADRYLESSSLGSIPVGSADRTFLSFYLTPTSASRVYGYGASSGSQHFSLRSRHSPNEVMFHHWSYDIALADVSAANDWQMAAHGVVDGHFVGFHEGRWVSYSQGLNTSSANPFRMFDSYVESSNAAGMTIARVYVFDRWLGVAAIERFWRAWQALVGAF